MIKYLASLGIVSIVACLSSSCAVAQGTRAATDPPRTVRLVASTQVPIELDPAGRPVVHALVNGQGPYRFGIDWGANVLAVSDSLGQGMPTLPRTTSGRPALVEVESLVIGTARFEGLTARHGGFLDSSVDGIIGYSVLKDLLTTFDFPNKTLTLSRDTLPEPDGETILPLVAADSGRLEAYYRLAAGDPRPRRYWGDSASESPLVIQPSVHVRVGDQVLSAVLDTRAPVWIALPDALVPAFSPIARAGLQRGEGPQTGAMRVQDIRLAEPMRLGVYTVSRPVVTFRNRPGPVIGMGVLGHFAVALDQRTGRVSLRHPSGLTELAQPSPAWESGDGQTSALGPEGADYAGVYETRQVTWEQGELYSQRIDLPTGSGRGPKVRLVPTSTPDEFAVVEVPGALFRFERDSTGNLVEVAVRQGDGSWLAGRRNWGPDPGSNTPSPTPTRTRGAAALSTGQTPMPASVSHAAFKRLDEWLIGRFRGTGGGQFSALAPFFEEYQRESETRVVMYTSSDSTFAQSTGPTRIELRGDELWSGSLVATVVTADSIRFEAGRGNDPTTVMRRVSADAWEVSVLSSDGTRMGWFNMQRLSAP